MTPSLPPGSWKEQQRALSARARIVHLHPPSLRKETGGLLRYPSGSQYEVLADGSLRRVRVHMPPQAVA